MGILSSDNTLAANPLAVLKPVRESRYYTLSEYLRREEHSRELHEYYNGIITKLPMALGPHNIISANMVAELVIACRAKTENSNYIVFNSQQLVYLPELNFSLYPDVLVVCETPQYYDKNEVLLINPVLIVEVLSRSTGKYDRTTKFDEYKTLDSFQEYVLINQKKCLVETRFKEETDLWREKRYTGMSDSVLLKSLNCSLDMQMIYRNVAFKKSVR